MKKKQKTVDTRRGIAYELYRTARRRSPRRSTIAFYRDELWQDDLVDMHVFADVNDGYRFLLTVIDIYS